MADRDRLRWLPDTLVWWVFAVLVFAVILISATLLVFQVVNRDDAGIVAAASQATDQVIVIKRMVERDKPEDRALLIRRFSSAMMRMEITRTPVVERSDNSFTTREVLRKLHREFPPGTDIRVDSLIEKPKETEPLHTEDENTAARQIEVIEIPPPAPPPDFRPGAEPRPPSPEEREIRRLRQMQLGGPALIDSRGMFRVSIKFAENTWFNARVLLSVGDDNQARTRPIFIETGVVILIAIAAVFGVYRAFRPLALFADAAERLGVDVNSEPLSEGGTGEVRRAARAFNTMQRRLKRFIEDRTQMLAAISHDLRTPITRLRLRAEFVDDNEQRAKMLRDLEEMETMISATLAFSRDDSAREPSVVLDIATLLKTVAGDAVATGHDVLYDGPARYDVLARPLSLKRAITNLVENAIKYGARARLTLEYHDDRVDVLIDDDGPGISDADRERVFAPFVRLEASRSRETGGVGLGLTIARNTIRGMGGDIDMRNRIGGGLRVRVTLPVAKLEKIAAE